MSSAVTARMNGLRVNAHAIPVATPIRSVAAAIQVAWVTELRKSSGVHTQSIPAASASRAWAARSSAVSAIAAIEMRSRALIASRISCRTRRARSPSPACPPRQTGHLPCRAGSGRPLLTLSRACWAASVIAVTWSSSPDGAGSASIAVICAWMFGISGLGRERWIWSELAPGSAQRQLLKNFCAAWSICLTALLADLVALGEELALGERGPCRRGAAGAADRSRVVTPAASGGERARASTSGVAAMLTSSSV